MWLKRIVVILLLTVPPTHLEAATPEDCRWCEGVREEVDDLKQKLETLKQELHYWQNTTLSILSRYTLNKQATTDCHCHYGQDLKNDIQYLIHQEFSNLKNASSSDVRECNNKLDEMKTLILQDYRRYQEIMDIVAAVYRPNNGSFHSPAVSCKHLKENYPATPSGQYWIQNPESGYASQQYCDMDRTNCGHARGWMRIAHLDMDIPSHHCPSGFREIASPVTACGRPSGTTCVSVIFGTNGVRYHRVTGKVIGYQEKTTNAFAHYFTQNRAVTLDGPYVDGVSITYGQPRKHIWTFAAAVDETRSNLETCPCTIAGVTYTGAIPPFVGNDYFCETGSRYQVENIFYDEDPLWDKEGCGAGSTCCNGSSFFCKDLLHAVGDDVELRLCCNGDHVNDEDVLVKHIEIYVQ